MQFYNGDLLLKEVLPPTTPQATLIFLHGLGGRNEDCLTVLKELERIAGLNLYMVLPQAQSMPITINNGLRMSAWYDILDLERRDKMDFVGIANAVQQILAIIAAIKQNPVLATKKIILAGFSQGAVISLATMLAQPGLLSAVAALSGYLPLAPNDLNNATVATPIFMAHGDADQVISYAIGYNAYIALKNANYKLSWHRYAMDHSICHNELKDLANWLQQLIFA
jgi:phospholipase/carboxylesterase